MSAVKEVIMTARVEALRAALYEVIDADCCGCSVYGEIAAEALGIDFKEYRRASTGCVK